QPMRFTIPFSAFDTDLIPESAREPGSPAFAAAVTSYYEEAFREIGGSVFVSFADDSIEVEWLPVSGGTLNDRVEAALAKGDLARAVPLLRAQTAVAPRDPTVHYNLGMALSDLGALDDARLHLVKAVHLDPDNVNALVALGVAHYRSGDAGSARKRLEQAIALEPSNGFAHRNLAAVLGNQGDRSAAIRHLRAARMALPGDPLTAYGLAHALEQNGTSEDLAEADGLYQQAIALDPRGSVVEMAKSARSRIAQREMRQAASGGLRMDAVMYLVGALQRFARMSPAEVQSVAFEIAVAGQQGIDVNNPGSRYELRSIPGEFTGMHLMCLMYAAFRQVAPEYDIGFDLANEYQAALSMHGAQEDRR
ncbi:MAG: tetratricopeptide repeat protein, partial [Thermomicrobiales bacterium]